jgi:hypothetical protein
MASTPGDWYDARRDEAERLEHELTGARLVLEACRAGIEAAETMVRRLERQLEHARHVGD